MKPPTSRVQGLQAPVGVEHSSVYCKSFKSGVSVPDSSHRQTGFQKTSEQDEPDRIGRDAARARPASSASLEKIENNNKYSIFNARHKMQIIFYNLAAFCHARASMSCSRGALMHDEFLEKKNSTKKFF